MNFFQIMPCRKSGFESTLEGFDLTGVHLVAYNDKCSIAASEVLSPSGLADNIGSFYFIPRLVQLTGINLETAIQIVYSGSVLIAFITAMVAILLSLKSFSGKLIAIIALSVLSLLIAGIGDYYVIAGSIPMAIIPWLIYLDKKPPISPKYLYLFFFIVGIIISLGHLIRSHSGTDVLIFILIFLIFFAKTYSVKQKIISTLILTLSIFSVFTWFNSIVDKRIQYLSNIETTYELSGERIKWHNIYYSLGYLSNNYGEVDGYDSHVPSDSYSLKRALEINPNVTLWSKDYEEILKKETFDFISNHKLFFLKSILAKVSVMLIYILLTMNIGIVMLFYFKNNLQFHLPFIAGITFNMLFGILTTPDFRYLTGLMLFSVLYSIYIIDATIFNNFVKKKWNNIL